MKRLAWVQGSRCQMDFSVINLELVAKLLLLLLIGMGPKIALVPFLEKTKHFDRRDTASRGPADGPNRGYHRAHPFRPRRPVDASPPHLGRRRRGCRRNYPGHSGNRDGHRTRQKSRGGISDQGRSKPDRRLSTSDTLHAQSCGYHRPHHRLGRGRLARERRAGCGHSALDRRVRLFDLCQHRQAFEASQSHQSRHI